MALLSALSYQEVLELSGRAFGARTSDDGQGILLLLHHPVDALYLYYHLQV